MTRFLSRKGFTLIELLIVVAIIAILAAIAVPNFLEAQTRSKVSRTKADMRTVATGLESYFVDHNKYPPDYNDQTRGTAGTAKYSMLIARLGHLTTPISYLTSLPDMVFGELVASGGAVRPSGAALSPAPYREGGVASGAIIRPVVYDYAKFDFSMPSPGIVDNPNIWAEISSQPGSVQWALNSAGPSPRIFEYLGFSGIVTYDPTNGTVSYGQVLRTNVSAEDKPKQ